MLLAVHFMVGLTTNRKYHTEVTILNNAKLQKIYSEAGRLFNQKGYVNTKMAEIAKASGIAVGTMYSAFTGKDAVLSFVIYATLDKDYLSSEIPFPIKPIESPKLITLLTKIIDTEFDSALNITDNEGNICKHFMKLMDELFDLFADYLLAFDNIETNAGILEELNEIYWPQKLAYFEKMGNYLRLYMENGQIRKLTHISSHVLFLTNTLTWWALNSNLSIPNEPIPRDTAKEICMGIIKRAYQI